MTSFNQTASDSLAQISDSVNVLVSPARVPEVDISITIPTPAAIISATKAQQAQQNHPEVLFKSFDVFTLAYFGTLPLNAVTWTETYNAMMPTGQLTATLAITAADPIWQDAIRQQRLIVIEVDGWPRWAGFLTKIEYDSDTETYSIVADDIWSFYDPYPITIDLSYAAVDEIAILEDILSWIASQPNSDLGLAIDAAMSGIQRDLVIHQFDNWLFGNIVRNHGTTIFDGYQLRIDCVYPTTAKIPKLILRAGSPTIGRRFDFNNQQLTPIFKLLPAGGNILDVQWTQDSQPQTGFVTRVVGTTTYTDGLTPPLSTESVNSVLRSAGYPENVYVMPAVQDYSSAALQARTDAELAKRASVYGAPVVTVTLDSIAHLQCGDDALFVFQDGVKWPTKVSYVYRVVQVQVNVDQESATLTLDPSSVGELTDESITPLLGTSSNNTGIMGGDPGGYYPSGMGPGPSVQGGYFPTGGSLIFAYSLVYRASSDAILGTNVPLSFPPGYSQVVLSGSGPSGVAALFGIAPPQGKPALLHALVTGTISGEAELMLTWYRFADGTPQSQVKQSAKDGAFSLSLPFTFVSPDGGAYSPALEIIQADGSWAITHLDFQFFAGQFITI